MECCLKIFGELPPTGTMCRCYLKMARALPSNWKAPHDQDLQKEKTTKMQAVSSIIGSFYHLFTLVSDKSLVFLTVYFLWVYRKSIVPSAAVAVTSY